MLLKADGLVMQAANIRPLVQVTALGNPKLLERVSNGVLTLQALFKQFDTDNNNVVTRDEFNQVLTALFLYPFRNPTLTGIKRSRGCALSSRPISKHES